MERRLNLFCITILELQHRTPYSTIIHLLLSEVRSKARRQSSSSYRHI